LAKRNAALRARSAPANPDWDSAGLLAWRQNE